VSHGVSFTCDCHGWVFESYPEWQKHMDRQRTNPSPPNPEGEP
jgi:hypothetical protein